MLATCVEIHWHTSDLPVIYWLFSFKIIVRRPCRAPCLGGIQLEVQACRCLTPAQQWMVWEARQSTVNTTYSLPSYCHGHWSLSSGTNSWGCISVQKARNQRNCSEEVLNRVNPSSEESLRVCTPCEFLWIPLFQQSAGEVPQKDWRKPSQAECHHSNGCSSPPQHLWDAAYSGRTVGDEQSTYNLDQIVIQQRHNSYNLNHFYSLI